MNNNTIIFSISWILWGIGYYLFQPFLSIFLIKFISPNDLGLFYLLSEVVALPFPSIGNILSKRFGIKFSIFFGMILSGLGLIILPFSKNFEELLISIMLNECFYIALPNYYAIMRIQGESVITKVWAISVSPAIIMPTIGGIIISSFGYLFLFLISGISILFSIIPLLSFNFSFTKEKLSVKQKIPFVIIFTIVPIALSSQFIYLVIKELYNLNLEIVGIIATTAEIIGMITTYLLSYVEPKKALYLSFSIFSMQIFALINPFFAVCFGIWEAIIPISIESRKSVVDFTYATTMQIVGWILGYTIATFIANPYTSIIFASILSLLLLPIIKRKY
ncbi:MFS transporter [Acidianus manzaensis]|uniref:MFS transporter n=1 Tax=Acidianus manzaensis TaxID=282676 RepID=A0A1W6K0M2_9CREN|nr:MFS transporter [Acidianus manzaensis]ARM76037.1 hypothetical protein B6F84_08390 [Acidianus manzaensis]